MSLSTDELNAIRAQWEEWAPDGFRLDVEVRSNEPVTTIVQAMPGAIPVVSPGVYVRLQSPLYCQVRIWSGPQRWTDGSRGQTLVFSERVPHDAGMLRASVTTLARYLASQAGEDG